MKRNPHIIVQQVCPMKKTDDGKYEVQAAIVHHKGIITPDERRQMTAGSGGQLNPTWVEWFMGWPLEWTALKPLAMGKYLLWRQLHSGFCSAES